MSYTASESEIPIKIVPHVTDLESEIKNSFSSLVENKPNSKSFNHDVNNPQLNDIQTGGTDDENNEYWRNKYIKYKDLYLSLKSK